MLHAAVDNPLTWRCAWRCKLGRADMLVRRYATAKACKNYAGTAPITRQPGKTMSPCFGPATVDAVNGVIGREVVGQLRPGDTTADEVEDRIQDQAAGVFLRPAAFAACRAWWWQ